jgi:molecular chaperone DnaK (HSP70)
MTPSSPTPTARYLVGIDLGTSHTALAYADLQQGAEATVQLFPIEQLVGPGSTARRPLLPSVRYHPAADELSPSDRTLPWGEHPPAFADPVPNVVVGEWARALGAKTHGRLVASAKSWLSHAGADRESAILPWGAAEEVAKVSPVLASASYLAHVRADWNQRFPEHPLERQDVVVTVPASFDEAARALTLEAAKLAGLPELRLLEEPMAVCYDWLWSHKGELRAQLADARLLLVVDVGGGTTDLTLIRIEHGGAEPRLVRIGVGNHLMLGGDNMDLSLAHLVENHIQTPGQRLSAAELSQLLEQCRLAKERLLSEDAPDSLKVTLLGGGSKLIGGARSAEISREEIRALVLDGFFPLSAADELPQAKRSGVVEFGLPYAAEPAVSKHVAAFLAQHRPAAAAALGEDGGRPMADAVLLNGGVFRSPLIAGRLLDLLDGWAARRPVHLDNPRPDLAVAYGAVAYGLARRGLLGKIGGGSARSYFLLVDAAQSGPAQGVCLLPKGTEEGEAIFLAERTFSLRLGQPVRLNLAATVEDSVWPPGALQAMDDSERFRRLPPLALALDAGSAGGRKEIPVRLAAELTEVGTLRVQCVAIDSPEQRWSLEFQLRGDAVARSELDSHKLPPRFGEAAGLVELCYGTAKSEVSPKAVKSLRADLEKILGPRDGWDGPLARELFGAFLQGGSRRRRSADHERLWLSLAGYTLRPGFGYPLDDWRVEQLWALYGQGLQFVNEPQNWAEWWILWRRVAGGLDGQAQQTLFDDLADYINPDTAKRHPIAGWLPKRSYVNMLRLAASLERLPAERKIQLGEWLLKRLAKAGELEESWWALGRIGARVPFHGSAHAVVPSETAAHWLEALLRQDWKKTPAVAFAATLIARMSGDRQRDLDAALREQAANRLREAKSPKSWLAMVDSVAELDASDEKRIFGEDLPPGLKLIN